MDQTQIKRIANKEKLGINLKSWCSELPQHRTKEEISPNLFIHQQLEILIWILYPFFDLMRAIELNFMWLLKLYSVPSRIILIILVPKEVQSPIF